MRIKKRQSIITLRHEGQSMQKISRPLKVSSSAVTKTIKRYDETGYHMRTATGKEDPELPLLQTIR
jgi:transposase